MRTLRQLTIDVRFTQSAADGTSENGRFYLIPQDYQSGPGHLARHAIGQDRLQEWLANRIKAKRAIILADTCEWSERGDLNSRPPVPQLAGRHRWR
jgi:hypothetical protein